MPMRTTLRVLVLLEAGCMVMAGVSGVVRESSLPEPLRSYSETQWAGDLTGSQAGLAALALLLLSAMVVASVGVLASWRPARILYTSTRVASVAIAPLLGPYIDDGWTELFDTAAFLTAGIVLGLLWWSPLAATFDRTPRPAGSPPASRTDAPLG